MAVTVITIIDGMGRWEPDARGRIEKAAMELYLKQGFEQTTVAQIAERAGVTERTFFRHFTDKREVLFRGSGNLLDLMEKTVASVPPSAAPIEAVAAALLATASVLNNREHSRRRQRLIRANQELQERELIKMASLASAMAAALRKRGVPQPIASLTAETGVLVFRIAFDRWISASNRRDLPDLIGESLDGLKAVIAEGRPSRTRMARV